MEVIRDINGYQTSKSYDTLWDLAKNQSIICLCKYGSHDSDYSCIDVAHTIFANGSVLISSRGICYIEAEDLADFVGQCRNNDLRWVLPETQYLVPPNESH